MYNALILREIITVCQTLCIMNLMIQFQCNKLGVHNGICVRTPFWAENQLSNDLLFWSFTYKCQYCQRTDNSLVNMQWVQVLRCLKFFLCLGAQTSMQLGLKDMSTHCEGII